MKIAALISGGVDSSVVVHLLKEQGYDPTIFYIRIGMDDDSFDCPAEEDIEITKWVAQKYGCKMEIVSLQQEYWDQVVAYTIDSVKRGFTPNPDVMCNKLIKFGSFEEKYGKEFDKIATGHYATNHFIDDLWWLGTAKDPIKDQTDFLAQINYHQLSKLMFPIGNMMKQDVRKIAVEAGLPSAARRDSQGICFLGKINYNDFLKRFLGEKEGPIIDESTGKKIGTHKGFWFHTIGQRKGLGLSQGPWFVVNKDTEENIVYVANGYDPDSQYGNEVRLRGMEFITRDLWGDFKDGHDITFKIRHTQDFAKGTIYKEESIYTIKAQDRIAGIAPGQFGVIYDAAARLCLGSGVIV
jgi:tRNA (5-methylaminomethyl-2-thiouridylate)-methyltransferase